MHLIRRCVTGALGAGLAAGMALVMAGPSSAATGTRAAAVTATGARAAAVTTTGTRAAAVTTAHRAAVVPGCSLRAICFQPGTPQPGTPQPLARPSAKDVSPDVDCVLSSVCNPGQEDVCIRENPSPAGGCVWLNAGTSGTGVYINCTGLAPTPAGPWGNDGIWDYITWSNEYGYTFYGWLNDNWVYTGTSGQFRPTCPSPWPTGNV
jgi:hypothetical protein